MNYTWQYYDLVLAGIVASLLAGATVGVATDVPLHLGVTGFSLVGVAILGHGLFVNGPVDEPEDLAAEVEALN